MYRPAAGTVAVWQWRVSAAEVLVSFSEGILRQRTEVSRAAASPVAPLVVVQPEAKSRLGSRLMTTRFSRDALVCWLATLAEKVLDCA